MCRLRRLPGDPGYRAFSEAPTPETGWRLKAEQGIANGAKNPTRQDCWTGVLKPSVPYSSIPGNFSKRVQRVLGLRDVVELTSRSPSELTIDHKLPLIRWNAQTRVSQTNYSEMSDDDIRDRFQMLKSSNGSVSHNLLKSRACETCYQTGNRGTPFGIEFFYFGDGVWEPQDKDDPTGCIGCGWYDFAKWRDELNSCVKKAGS